MAKIQMKTPLVEMDGDEMTRILWKIIKDELIYPFITTLVWSTETRQTIRLLLILHTQHRSTVLQSSVQQSHQTLHV